MDATGMVYSSDQAALAGRRAFEVTAEWADCDVHHIRCNVNVSRPIS